MQGQSMGIEDASRPRLAVDEATVFAAFSALTDLRGKTVLEIGGCLSGDITAPHGVARWISCDPRFGAGRRGHTERLGCGAERVPLGHGSVDLVFSCNALQHVRDPRQVFREAWRVLRTGGSFYAHFGPVWSAPDGAHIEGLGFGGRDWNFWDRALLPSWAHLLCDSEEELAAWLSDVHDLAFATAISRYVFRSEWINRTPADAFADATESAGFKPIFWRKCPAFGYDYRPPAPGEDLARRLRNDVLGEVRSRHRGVVDDLETRDIEFLLEAPSA